MDVASCLEAMYFVFQPTGGDFSYPIVLKSMRKGLYFSPDLLPQATFPFWIYDFKTLNAAWLSLGKLWSHLEENRRSHIVCFRPEILCLSAVPQWEVSLRSHVSSRLTLQQVVSKSAVYKPVSDIIHPSFIYSLSLILFNFWIYFILEIDLTICCPILPYYSIYKLSPHLILSCFSHTFLWLPVWELVQHFGQLRWF